MDTKLYRNPRCKHKSNPRLNLRSLRPPVRTTHFRSTIYLAKMRLEPKSIPSHKSITLALLLQTLSHNSSLHNLLQCNNLTRLEVTKIFPLFPSSHKHTHTHSSRVSNNTKCNPLSNKSTHFHNLNSSNSSKLNLDMAKALISSTFNVVYTLEHNSS